MPMMPCLKKVSSLSPKSWAVLFVIIGVLRILHCYTVLDIHFDEPQHAITGLEWLENGTYKLEALHPPLTKIMIALPLYLKGIRFGAQFYKDNVFSGNTPENYPKNDLNRIKYGMDIFVLDKTVSEYRWNLTLSRVGVLPFFILSAIILFILSKHLYGEKAAATAVFFFTTLPTVLGEAILAATDMGCTFSVLFSIYCGSLWLTKPSFRNALFLGIALGLISVIKFSGIYFFILSAIAALLLRDFSTKQVSRGFNNLVAAQILLMLCICLGIIWSLYRFSTAPLNDPSHLYHIVFEYMTEDLLKVGLITKNAAQYLGEHIVVPAPEFWDGLFEVSLRNHTRQAGYVFGHHLKYEGVWYYFLVATIFKLPLSFLILAILGIIYTISEFLRTRSNWQRALPPTAVIAMYIGAMGFNINIAIRHMLPAISLLCICAGNFVTYPWNSIAHEKFNNKSPLDQDKPTKTTLQNTPFNKLQIFMIATCLISYSFSSITAHPYYKFYFNFAAGNNPETILATDNIDWSGMSLSHAISILRERNLINDTMVFSRGFMDPRFLGALAGMDALTFLFQTPFMTCLNPSFRHNCVSEDYRYTLISIGLYFFITEMYSKHPEDLPTCKTKPETLLNGFYLFDGEICSW